MKRLAPIALAVALGAAAAWLLLGWPDAEPPVIEEPARSFV